MRSRARKTAAAAALCIGIVGASALPAAAKATEPPHCRPEYQDKYYLNGTSRQWYYTGSSNIIGGRRYSFRVVYHGYGGDSWGTTWCDVRA